jgi:hypothetical protein
MLDNVYCWFMDKILDLDYSIRSLFSPRKDNENDDIDTLLW